MGRLFLQYPSGTRIFCCAKCNTPLTNKENLRSTRFTGSTGRAFLFDTAWNVKFSGTVERVMLTGRHTVRDVFCVVCSEKIGWTYEYACEEGQRYKEGKVILEKLLIKDVPGMDGDKPFYRPGSTGRNGRRYQRNSQMDYDDDDEDDDLVTDDDSDSSDNSQQRRQPLPVSDSNQQQVSDARELINQARQVAQRQQAQQTVARQRQRRTTNTNTSASASSTFRENTEHVMRQAERSARLYQNFVQQQQTSSSSTATNDDSQQRMIRILSSISGQEARPNTSQTTQISVMRPVNIQEAVRQSSSDQNNTVQQLLLAHRIAAQSEQSEM